MAIASITSWLQGSRDYPTGMVLLQKYCNNQFLIRVLSKSDSAFNRKKLADELEKIDQAEIPAEARFVDPTVSEFLNLPLAIQEEKKKANLLFKEMASLFAQLQLLEEAGKKEELAKAIFRIMDCDHERYRCWKKINEFTRTGKIPEVKESKGKSLSEMSPLQLERRRLVVRSYLSKGYVQYQQELNELNELLK